MLEPVAAAGGPLRLVSAAEMQAMDRMAIAEWGIPGRVLMECAGRGATRVLLERFPGALRQRVGILAGRGNNGGDGFVIARCLAALGGKPTVFLLAEPDRISGDAGANLELVRRLGIPVIVAADAASVEACRPRMSHMQLWVDALFGTGLNAAIHGVARRAIETVNGFDRPVLAVDIASGIHCDTGQVCGVAIRAAATATFAFAKPGHLLYPGAAHSGEVTVVEIGIPAPAAAAVPSTLRLLTPDAVGGMLPPRQEGDHKGRTGHVLVVAGAAGKSGAAALASLAALRAGAGLVTLAVPRSIQAVVAGLCPEAMTLGLPESGQGETAIEAMPVILEAAAGKRCVAIGPGLGMAAGTVTLVHHLLRQLALPVVLDADGLNALARDPGLLRQRPAATVLTPHPGEMARLTGKPPAAVQADRIGSARSLARDGAAVVVLKGATTVVAGSGGLVSLNPTGNPGMASGGMGDVLTGVVAGLIAQQMPVEAAACAGVFLHGAAADLLAERRGPQGYLAGEVGQSLPEVLRRLREGNWPPGHRLPRRLEP
jgi:NAD(P)H-hydrate epimerase